jgi:hypothetical protein
LLNKKNSMNLIDESEDKSLPNVAIIIVATAIGLVGVYLRFADFRHSSEIGDLVMSVPIVVIFASVFNWLKK